MPIPFTLNRTDYEAFEQRGVKLYGMRNTHALAKGSRIEAPTSILSTVTWGAFLDIGASCNLSGGTINNVRFGRYCSVASGVVIGAQDACRVMVRALDQLGNKLPFFPEPVSITVTGPARRIGPGFVPLRAGSTGFWIQAQGPGEITLTVSNDRLGTIVTQILAE